MKKSKRVIDHILLCVPDLEDARAVYQGFGFLMTPYGDHRPLLGTANYTVTFPTNFLELLAIIDSSIPSAIRQEDVDRRAGVHMMGFKTDDVAADIETFGREAPDQWTEQRVSTRRMTLDNGEDVTGSIDYTMQRIDLDRELRFFVGKNTTSEVTWNPDFMNHENGARKIAADVDFEPASRRPHAAGLRIEVGDCDAVAAFLERSGKAFHRGSGGTVRIPPGEACGLYLEFTERA